MLIAAPYSCEGPFGVCGRAHPVASGRARSTRGGVACQRVDL